MHSFLSESVFFGCFISLFAYELGVYCKKKWNVAIVNPLLIGIVVTILVVKLIDMEYDTYYEGAKYIGYLLTPATICLAIPLYEQFELLKKNVRAVLAGIVSGVFTSVLTVLGLAVCLGLTHEEYITFLPKSITTAIGMGVSEKLGGIVPVTVAVIIITGVIGNIIAEPVCRLFHITHPIAKGVGIGSAAHAVGTARAMEMGEIEGAMSSLSLVVAGILTVFVSILFSAVY